jgi:hypothetical protein
MTNFLRFLLAAVFLLNLAGCTTGHPRQMNDLWDGSATAITAINLRSGSTGALAILTELEQIEAFLLIIDGKALAKSKDQAKKTGYGYAVEMISGNQKVSQILLGGPQVNIDGTCYDLEEEIPMPVLDAFFNTLETVEE